MHNEPLETKTIGISFRGKANKRFQKASYEGCNILPGTTCYQLLVIVVGNCGIAWKGDERYTRGREKRGLWIIWL